MGPAIFDSGWKLGHRLGDIVMKQLTFNENSGEWGVEEFLCYRLVRDPSLARCDVQCKVCFEADAKHEFDTGHLGPKQ